MDTKYIEKFLRNYLKVNISFLSLPSLSGEI
jgi:hypothetical protein